MKGFIEIIKDKKAYIQRDIILLKKLNGIYQEDTSDYNYYIHSFEYLFKLAILLKQDLLLDEILASYFGQEEDSQFLSGASPGKEV